MFDTSIARFMFGVLLAVTLSCHHACTSDDEDVSSASIAEARLTLPEYYGQYAVDDNQVIDLESLRSPPDFTGDVTFLVFDRRITSGPPRTSNADVLHRIPLTVASPPLGRLSPDPLFFARDNPNTEIANVLLRVMDSQRDHLEMVDAALSSTRRIRIPASQSMRVRSRPVSDEPEMIRFEPSSRLDPGLYLWNDEFLFWVDRKKIADQLSSHLREQHHDDDALNEPLRRWSVAAIALTVYGGDTTASATTLDEFRHAKFDALFDMARIAADAKAWSAAQKLNNRIRNLPRFAHTQETAWREFSEVTLPFKRSQHKALLAWKERRPGVAKASAKRALELRSGDVAMQSLLERIPYTRLEFAGNPVWARLCPDGEVLFTGEGSRITSWNIRSGQVVERQSVPGRFGSSQRQILFVQIGSDTLRIVVREYLDMMRAGRRRVEVVEVNEDRSIQLHPARHRPSYDPGFYTHIALSGSLIAISHRWNVNDLVPSILDRLRTAPLSELESVANFRRRGSFQGTMVWRGDSWNPWRFMPTLDRRRRATNVALHGNTSTLAVAERRVAQRRDDEIFVLWDLVNEELIGSFGYPGGVLRGFSRSGREVIITRGSSVTFWDVGSQRKIRTIDVGEGAPGAMIMSRDGNTMVIVRQVEERRWLMFYELNTGRLMDSFVVGAGRSGMSLSLSNDGRWLLTSRPGKPPLLWDLRKVLHDHPEAAGGYRR